MTLTIDLTPTEEAQLAALARQRGAAPAEFVQRLVKEQLPPMTASAPNEKALAALRDIAEIKKGMPETDGSQTDQMLREGRAGAMYGP